MLRTSSSRNLFSAGGSQSDFDIENPPDRSLTRRGHLHYSLPAPRSHDLLHTPTTRSSLGHLSNRTWGYVLRSLPMQSSVVLSPIMRRYVFVSLGCIILSCQIYFFPGIVHPALDAVAVFFLGYFFFKITSRINLGLFRNREDLIFFRSTGEFSAVRRSRISGLAVEKLENDAVYAGEFKRGIRNGRGLIKIPGRWTYEGDWVGGDPNGYGVEKFLDFGEYTGQFSGHMKSGYGYMVYCNRDEYMGQWLNGEIHGMGRYESADGSFYEGQFVRGRKHGYGEYRYSQGDTYKGEFHNDQRTGVGILTYSFGDRYEGSWHADQMEGLGVYIKIGDNERQPGMWANGNRIIPMHMPDPDIERAVQTAREAAWRCRKLDEIKDKLNKAVKKAVDASRAARALATKAHSLNELHLLNPERLIARARYEIIALFQDLRRTSRKFGSSIANLARYMAG